MIHVLAFTIASLLVPVLTTQPPGATEPARAAPKLSDAKRATIAVLENHDSFWPFSTNYNVWVAGREAETFDVSVKMLGQCQTADGPRKIAVVSLRAEAPGVASTNAAIGSFVVYFSTDMKLLDHHNQGCGGEIRLEGNIIHLGGRKFDLSTRDGLAAFKMTQNWC